MVSKFQINFADDSVPPQFKQLNVIGVESDKPSNVEITIEDNPYPEQVKDHIKQWLKLTRKIK